MEEVHLSEQNGIPPSVRVNNSIVFLRLCIPSLMVSKNYLTFLATWDWWWNHLVLLRVSFPPLILYQDELKSTKLNWSWKKDAFSQMDLITHCRILLAELFFVLSCLAMVFLLYICAILAFVVTTSTWILSRWFDENLGFQIYSWILSWCFYESLGFCIETRSFGFMRTWSAQTYLNGSMRDWIFR